MNLYHVCKNYLTTIFRLKSRFFPTFAASRRKPNPRDGTTNETYLFDYLHYRSNDGSHDPPRTDPRRGH